MGEQDLKKEEGENQDRAMGEKKDNSVLSYSQNLDLCVCDVKENFLEPGSRPKRRKEKRMGDIWGPEQRIMTQCVKQNNEATNSYAD